jgi:hypothetical protein
MIHAAMEHDPSSGPLDLAPKPKKKSIAWKNSELLCLLGSAASIVAFLLRFLT